jgi:hypothetical protein
VYLPDTIIGEHVRFAEWASGLSFLETPVLLQAMRAMLSLFARSCARSNVVGVNDNENLRRGKSLVVVTR